MTNRIIAVILFLVAITGVCTPVIAQEPEVLQLTQRVTDLTGTLSSSEIAGLNEELATFESQTSNQIVVLMLPTFGGGALEDYAIRVAEKNKMGKKDHNNGVLLLVVKDDHKIRIEVGYGLEGALTDLVSGQIIRNEIGPAFKSGDFAGGISAGVHAIEAVTKGEYKGDGDTGGGRRRGTGLPLIFVIMILLFSFIGRIFSFRRHYIGSRGAFSRYPWWWGGGGGFGGGGFGGGSGGGFGGGGFSGGGGSFGGGGASGSW